MTTGSFTTTLDLPGEDDAEVIVEWEGYYEPAFGMGGPWENSTQASGEMEIIVVRRMDNGHSYEPTAKQLDQLTEEAWKEYHATR